MFGLIRQFFLGRVVVLFGREFVEVIFGSAAAGATPALPAHARCRTDASDRSPPKRVTQILMLGQACTLPLLQFVQACPLLPTAILGYRISGLESLAADVRSAFVAQGALRGPAFPRAYNREACK